MIVYFGGKKMFYLKRKVLSAVLRKTAEFREFLVTISVLNTSVRFLASNINNSTSKIIFECIIRLQRTAFTEINLQI